MLCFCILSTVASSIADKPASFGNKNLSCLSASQNWQIQRWVRASIAPLTSAGMKPCLPDLICSFQSGKVRDRDKQAPKDASEVRQLQA